MKTPSDIVARQRAIVEELAGYIRAAKSHTGWVSTDGGSFAADLVPPITDIDESFTDRILIDRAKFTGLPRGGIDKPARRGLIAFLRNALRVPPSFVCQLPLIKGDINLGPLRISLELAAYQERLRILHKTGILQKIRDRDRPIILEVGGGFGALAYCVKRIAPQATYIIVDLPSSLVASGCYLAHAAARKHIAVYSGGKLPDTDFVLVPDGMLSDLTGTEIDLAINTLSFSEMDEGTVAGYARFIAGNLKISGVLFEQNFDNTPLNRQFCDAARVLGRTFSHRYVVPGKYWRGVPSVWSMTPTA